MYIRTKDGVFEVTKDTKERKFIVAGKNKTLLDYETFIYSELEVIAQSENLEELCEGFYIDEGNEFSFYQENAYENFEEAKRDFFTNFYRTSTLYAFIKTSEGLIYVAKMNDKGELELI